MGKKVLVSIIIVITVVLFFLDIFNVPEKMNLYLNFEAWNVYFVMVIFVITYFTITNKDVERKQNQGDVAKALLNRTYNSVLEYEEIIGTEIFRDAVKKRIPGDEMLPESKMYNNMQIAPFSFDEEIIKFAMDGIIIKKDIEKYLEVKNSYQKYLSNYIIFGNNEITEIAKRNLDESLKSIE